MVLHYYSRNRLVGEVRRRQTKEAVIQGQRVRLVYKKGPKTYFEYCPAGVASTVDSNLLCGKGCNIMLICLGRGARAKLWCIILAQVFCTEMIV